MKTSWWPNGFTYGLQRIVGSNLVSHVWVFRKSCAKLHSKFTTNYSLPYTVKEKNVRKTAQLEKSFNDQQRPKPSASSEKSEMMMMNIYLFIYLFKYEHVKRLELQLHLITPSSKESYLWYTNELTRCKGLVIESGWISFG